ncbi:MAG: PAS domain S-box protein [Candidatus Celaenobacter polaris]|nr:PAS domain S-box protein [Candidatus Celaenobacter polaris]
MKLNLRTKLIGSFVIILILMVGVGLMGTYTSKTIRDRLDNIIERDVKPANILGDVARRVGFVRANSLLHLLTSSIEDMNRYESEVADWIDKTNTNLDTLENTFLDQATVDKLAEFRTAWETYLRIWREQVVPLSRANRDEEAFTLARTGGIAGTAAREAMYKLDELHDVNVAAANHRLKLAEQDFRKSQYILSAVILLAIILGLAFGIRQGSLIAGPVNAVSKAVQLVAAGDFDQKVEVKTGDEIESMADSFNAMTVKLKTMVEELRYEITERKRDEEALAASKTYTESIIQNFLDTLIVVDIEAKIETVNPATCDLLGYTEEELIGQPITIIFAEEEEEEVRRFFQFFREPKKVEDLRTQDTVRNRELTYKTKDGRLIPMLFNVSVLIDKMGDVTGVVAGAKDITDIKRAEAVVKKERNFSANVIATVPDSLVVVDKDLRIKSANRSFYQTFQMEPENVIGASITEILGDKDGKLSTELLNLFGTDDMLDGFELQYQSKRSGLPREVRSLTSQGKRVLNVIARTIIFAEEEEEEEEELIVLQDITSRKQAEETLQRFNEELEQKVTERTLELDKKIKESEQQRVATLNLSNDLENKNVDLLYEIAERKHAEKIQKALYSISNALNTTDKMRDFYSKIREYLGNVLDTKNFYVALYDEKTDYISLPFDVDEKDIFETFPAGKTLTALVIKTGKPLFANRQLQDKLTKQGKIDIIGTPSLIWMGVPLKIENKVIGVIVVQSYDDPHLYSEKDIEILTFISEEISLAIEHKQAEERIRRDLKEKELLLREIHHRVKNNLQVISSLLQLQENEITTKEDALKGFAASQDRILAMAKAYELLLQSEYMSEVSMGKYIESLAEQLKYNYDVHHKVKISYSLEELTISIEILDRLGLVLNEIITNAIKYAFEGREVGNIYIELKETEKHVVIKISDDGIGMPENIDINDPDTLGLSIVAMLMTQLRGTLKLDIKNGTSFAINIPIE